MKEARLKADISQAEAADQIGINRRNYIRYEKGENQPSLVSLVILADLFEVSIDYLLGRSIVDLSNEEHAIITAYRKIPADKWGNALKVLEALR